MDEQRTPPRTPARTRKEIRDKERKRAGAKQKKRIHVYQNPLKLAKRGWEQWNGTWTFDMASYYVEWCHISKVFHPCRFNHNRRFNKANLAFCQDPEFLERCIEVYQVLYNTARVVRNEAPLFLCRGVWVELKLGRTFDWSTVNIASTTIHVPAEEDGIIPRGVRRFPDGGLGRVCKPTDQADNYHTDDSEEDLDSDGTPDAPPPLVWASRKRKLFALTAPQPVELNVVSSTQEEEMLELTDTIATPPARVIVAEDLSAAVAIGLEGIQIPSSFETEQPGRQAIQSFRRAFEEKNAFIRRLVEDQEIAAKRLAEKDAIIEAQKKTIESLTTQVAALSQRGRVQAGSSEDPMDIEPVNRVVDNLVGGLISDEREGTTTFQRVPRVNLPSPFQDSDSLGFPPLRGAVNYGHVTTFGDLNDKEILDSIEACEDLETGALKKKLANHRRRIIELLEQFFQWKVACIWSVDKGRQMAKEYKRVANEYMEHNNQRQFGLTSWASPDELFPDSLKMKKIVLGGDEGQRTTEIIDWAAHGWDHENALSCHVQTEKRRLWPRIATFVEDGSVCIICTCPFGPEGGYHLGSCIHIYHPICLIGLMLSRRRCAACKAPFHERLYELFGLVPYMPPSWECNPENSPDMERKWGEDLLWSWRLRTHSLYKAGVSRTFGWHTDPESIKKVCHGLVPRKGENWEGKREFFYQCFNGHWDDEKKCFVEGRHPSGQRWKKDGTLLSAEEGYSQLEIERAQANSESEWNELFTSDGIDFLLEQHSPETLQVLRQMESSQFVQGLLEVDGPALRTRSKSKRPMPIQIGRSTRAALQIIGDDSEDEHIPHVTNLNDGAGPSGTS